MTISRTRRLIAAIASAGLLLLAVPTASTVSAATTACAPGATCNGALAGKLGAAPFQIQMPAKFNGTVLLYSHGYRFSGPIPAAFAGPTALGLTKNPFYGPVSVPAFAAGFGSDVAFQSNNNPEVATDPFSAQALLAQGFALAGSGYARQGWAVAEGVEANENLITYINGGGIKGAKRMMLWGPSLGGIISQTVAERNPYRVAAVMPVCGAVTGPEQVFSGEMSLIYTWKTLIAPTLKGANYTAGAAGYGEALTDLGTVFTILGKVGAGALSVSPVGYPIAQANLLAGLVAGLPTKSSVYDGQTVNPAFGTLGTAAALAGGYQPASAGASSAAAMLQNVGTAAALGILGRYDLEQRARLIASIPATESANFSDNVGVSYNRLLSPEQRGEFGDTLNSTSVMPNALNAMIAALDASRFNAAARFPANPKAIAAVRAIPAPRGAYGVPTVLMSTTYDPAVPAGNTGWLHDRLLASYNKGPVSGPFKVLTYYTVPPADGWTQFDAGAKGPNSAASVVAMGGSGVGHCQFTPRQLEGAVLAWLAIARVQNGTQIKAINRQMWQVVGVNGDGGFQPDPLKRPGLLSKAQAVADVLFPASPTRSATSSAGTPR
ncbi:MAG: hypothetical protein WCP95_12390 [Actinomycetes bacterium]